MFSEIAKYWSKLARTSQLLGGAALLISILQIFANSSLSTSQKIGQISVSLLGFGITAYVTGAAALLLGGTIGAAVSILVAASLALSITLLNAIYFSALPINRNRYFA
jgi:hypothetical protein